MLENRWVEDYEDAAFEQGLAGIFSLQLRELAATQNCDPFGLPSWHRQVFVANARFLAFLELLSIELQRHKLHCVVLKGAASLVTAYGGNLGLRPLSDVDLLVAPKHEKTVTALLESLGLRAYGLCFRSADLEVDLHTDLLGANLLGRRHRAFIFDEDEVWSCSLAFGAGTSSLRVLSPDFQILHQATHLLRHSYSRWIWLVDLALMLPRADPIRIVELAASTHTLRVLAYAVHLLEKLFHFSTKRELSSRLPRLGGSELRAVHEMADRPQRLSCGKEMAAWSIPGWRSRVGYLWELLLPNQKVLAWYYPSQARPWLAIRRIAKAGRHLGRVVRFGL